MFDGLCDLLGCHHPRLVPGFGVARDQDGPLPDPHWFLDHLNLIGTQFGAAIMATFQMTDSQQVDLSIAAVDKRGNPTGVAPGTVSWLVDNPNVVSITPAADGLTAVLKAVGPVGDFHVTVNATVAGAAVTGVLEGTIVPGAPTQITVTPGTPTEQP